MSCPTCAILRRERDEALEQVRQLKAAAFAPADEVAKVAAFLGLTPSEAVMVTVLLHRDVASRAAMMDALYFADPNGGGHNKIVDVMLVRIRRKLRAIGIEVITIPAIGWRLDADAKRKLRAKMTGDAA